MYILESYLQAHRPLESHDQPYLSLWLFLILDGAEEQTL